MSYAVPACGHVQLYVVFALAERKNDVQIQGRNVLPQAELHVHR